MKQNAIFKTEDSVILEASTECTGFCGVLGEDPANGVYSKVERLGVRTNCTRSEEAKVRTVGQEQKSGQDHC